MEQKLKAFLNSLSHEEALEFWRFLRTKKFSAWVDSVVHSIKIQ